MVFYKQIKVRLDCSNFDRLSIILSLYSTCQRFSVRLAQASVFQWSIHCTMIQSKLTTGNLTTVNLVNLTVRRFKLCQLICSCLVSVRDFHYACHKNNHSVFVWYLSKVFSPVMTNISCLYIDLVYVGYWNFYN